MQSLVLVRKRDSTMITQRGWIKGLMKYLKKSYVKGEIK